MPKIKLKEWADKHNLSYLTANRHFHQGMIPGAIQLDSGTILVEDDSVEQNMANNTSSDAMSLFLKKTVEFSKSNSSVEDFAAYVISNFQLKLNGAADAPRYSKNRPKPEEVQKHFQQFIPDPKDIEHLKAVKSLLKEGKTAGDVVPAEAAVAAASSVHDNSGVEMMESLLNNFETSPNVLSEDVDVHMYGNTTEGLVTRSVDCNTTPQQINYTGSTNQAFSSSLSPTIVTNSVTPINGDVSGSFVTPSVAALADMNTTGALYFNDSFQAPFQPTQKELLSSAKVIETAEDAPRKRGRKPAKKR